MACIHCKQHHPDYYSHCPETGEAIEDAKKNQLHLTITEFCVACGQQNKEQYINCSNCGGQLGKVNIQKSNLSKLLNQTAQSIPLSGEAIKNNLKTDQVKSASIKNFQYIRNNPLILLPAVISIVLMIVFSIFIKNSIQDTLTDILPYELNEIHYLMEPDAFKELIKEELEDDDVRFSTMKIPNFPYLSTMIMLATNASYDVNFQVKGIDEIQIKGAFKSIFMSFSLLTILILLVGAIIYGLMATRYKWEFWRGIAYSSLLYTLFIAIVAFLARHHIKIVGASASDGNFEVIGSVTPSFINTIIVSLILSTIIYSFIGYIAYNGKNTFNKLFTEIKYIQYVFYSLTVTIVGLLIHHVHSFFVTKDLSNSPFTDFIGDLSDQGAFTDFVFLNLSAFIQTLITWQLSFFGQLSLTMGEDRFTETFRYQWFIGDKPDDMWGFNPLPYLEEHLLSVSPILFVLLAILLIAMVGYSTLKTHQLKLKEIAIFSAFFTAIQVLLALFITITVQFSTMDSSKITFAAEYSLIYTVLGTFLLCFVALYLGGYVRQRYRS